MIAFATSGCGAEAMDAFPWNLDAPIAEWHLPGRLEEISGLAVSADDRLFGHNDERAVIYEIDRAGGALVKGFALAEGDAPPVRDDFEGIAIAGRDFYLVSSTGVLYRSREGADGERVPFETFDTGAGSICEVEGLAFDAVARQLLLACKRLHDRAAAPRVVVLAYALSDGAPTAADRIEIDVSALSAPVGVRGFHPSSLEVLQDGRLLLLAGRERLIALIERSGQVIAVRRLDRERHVQPEGVTVTEGGDLVIADEGRKRRARLAIYRSE
jgi:uncharacterized protein YjiK